MTNYALQIMTTASETFYCDMRAEAININVL
jgi:hypothetical protein